MVQILHISDPHAQAESMMRLHNLAMRYSEIDVIALTGDCTSQTTDQLPLEWNGWPQELKLSVPGNHDCSSTFDCLATWIHRPPWTARIDDLLFIGVDSVAPEKVANYLDSLEGTDANGIVLLSHRQPVTTHGSYANALQNFVGSKQLLILHGHEHPGGFSGAEWDESGLLIDKPFLRSKVCSSVSRRRGLGRLIQWRRGSFCHQLVQGSLAPESHVTARSYSTGVTSPEVLAIDFQNELTARLENLPADMHRRNGVFRDVAERVRFRALLRSDKEKIYAEVITKLPPCR